MAYEKQTWVTGEVITEEKLNHMEDGIAGIGVSFVKIGNYNGTFGANSTVLINAQPPAYHSFREPLKQLLNEGKTIIGFAMDCDTQGIKIYSVLIENDSFVVHQKEDGIMDDKSKLLKVIYVRTDSIPLQVSFIASVYAICI